MKTNSVQVTVGRLSFDVPIHRTPKETQALAQKLAARLTEIEAQSTRIDTQVFALKAALSFAAELASLQEQVAQETEELLDTLNDISEALQAILSDTKANRQT